MGTGSSTLNGIPLCLCCREGRAAVEERERTVAMLTQILSGRFVDLMGARVEHDSVVRLRPLNANEAACHILLHDHRVAAERIAPAATSTGDQAQEVAAPQLDTVAR